MPMCIDWWRCIFLTYVWAYSHGFVSKYCWNKMLSNYDMSTTCVYSLNSMLSGHIPHLPHCYIHIVRAWWSEYFYHLRVELFFRHSICGCCWINCFYERTQICFNRTEVSFSWRRRGKPFISIVTSKNQGWKFSLISDFFPPPSIVKWREIFLKGRG